MKIKISEKLLDTVGKEIKAEGNPALTLRDACVQSILTPIQGEEEKSKWAKYEIFKKLRDAKEEVTLSVEEVALIKKVIGTFQPQLIMGQCWELIEGNEKKQTK